MSMKYVLDNLDGWISNRIFRRHRRREEEHVYRISETDREDGAIVCTMMIVSLNRHE